MQKVELPDEIKKKSFSQSVQAVVQSSDLICFQGPFCFLLSCCASNRATAMGNINPCNATRIWDYYWVWDGLLSYTIVWAIRTKHLTQITFIIIRQLWGCNESCLNKSVMAAILNKWPVCFSAYSLCIRSELRNIASIFNVHQDITLRWYDMLSQSVQPHCDLSQKQLFLQCKDGVVYFCYHF